MTFLDYIGMFILILSWTVSYKIYRDIKEDKKQKKISDAKIKKFHERCDKLDEKLCEK